MDWSLIAPPGPAANAQTSLANVPTPSARVQSSTKLLSPENPLLVWGVLAALTFGAMAFSTSVRVGHTTAGLNVGSTS
jgi:hypothetical protein